jgi:ABC-type nitrate/sulfonate/bicarbonate transport system substrate-binding protein
MERLGNPRTLTVITGAAAFGIGVRRWLACYSLGFVAVVGAAPADAKTIRLGWQTTWATQGQLVIGLKRSNIPQLAGIELEYPGFAYGGPLNQAALAGQVDILLTADQPAVALMSRTNKFKIVARMMYNRTCVYVPPSSPLTGLADLAGKSVGGPVGAAAERIALAAMTEAGVDLASVRFGNIDMERQAILLSAQAKDSKWSAFDALYGFDPMPAVFETSGAVRMLHCGQVVSVIMASEEMLTARKAELKNFLVAFLLSWKLFAQEPAALNARYLKEVDLSFSARALEIAAAVEPNMRAESIDQIRMTFSEQDLKTIDKASDFLVGRKAIAKPLDVRSPKHLDLTALSEAVASGLATQLLPRVRLQD